MVLESIFLPFTRGYPELLFVSDLFSRGIKQYTRQLLTYIERIKPDAIVTDFAFYSTNVAADKAALPWITLYHSGLPFRGKNIPPFGSGLAIGPDYNQPPNRYTRLENFIVRLIDRRVNRARQAYGLAPLAAGILRRPSSPWLNLVTSAEAIEAPRDNLTVNTFYIGPCFQGRQNTGDGSFPFEQLRSNRYKVYLSLGTVFNNQPQIFQKFISALQDETFQLIISAGEAYQTLASQPLPPNVLLFKSVPQLDLLPKVDLVIGHGGNNTTNETLAAGKPLLVLPQGGEQHDNARRIEYLGVGIRLDSKKLSQEQIYAKVSQVRDNPAFANRARELQATLTQTNGPRSASALIEWVAQNHQPLERPEGQSLTLRLEDLEAVLGQNKLARSRQ